MDGTVDLHKDKHRLCAKEVSCVTWKRYNRTDTVSENADAEFIKFWGHFFSWLFQEAHDLDKWEKSLVSGMAQSSKGEFYHIQSVKLDPVRPGLHISYFIPSKERQTISRCHLWMRQIL